MKDLDRLDKGVAVASRWSSAPACISIAPDVHHELTEDLRHILGELAVRQEVSLLRQPNEGEIDIPLLDTIDVEHSPLRVPVKAVFVIGLLSRQKGAGMRRAVLHP